MVIGFVNIDDTRGKFTKRANIFLSFLLAYIVHGIFFFTKICVGHLNFQGFLQYVFFGDKV
jgi:hypothetical protein